MKEESCLRDTSKPKSADMGSLHGIHTHKMAARALGGRRGVNRPLLWAGQAPSRGGCRPRKQASTDPPRGVRVCVYVCVSARVCLCIFVHTFMHVSACVYAWAMFDLADI